MIWCMCMCMFTHKWCDETDTSFFCVLSIWFLSHFQYCRPRKGIVSAEIKYTVLTIGGNVCAEIRYDMLTMEEKCDEIIDNRKRRDYMCGIWRYKVLHDHGGNVYVHDVSRKWLHLIISRRTFQHRVNTYFQTNRTIIHINEPGYVD